MPPPSNPPAPEAVAEVCLLPGGDFIIRPKGGRTLRFTDFARTARQADGSLVLTPLAAQIETVEAAQILGVPWTTLRRLIENGAVKAHKRSPRRWTVDLESVLKLKEAQCDAEYWGRGG